MTSGTTDGEVNGNDIELDYTLPRDSKHATPDNDLPDDLLCGLCDALPPASTRLKLCAECDMFICGACALLPSRCKHAIGRNRNTECAKNGEPPDKQSVKATEQSRSVQLDRTCLNW